MAQASMQFTTVGRLSQETADVHFDDVLRVCGVSVADFEQIDKARREKRRFKRSYGTQMLHNMGLRNAWASDGATPSFGSVL
jgi:hypothetical protein